MRLPTLKLSVLLTLLSACTGQVHSTFTRSRNPAAYGPVYVAGGVRTTRLPAASTGGWVVGPATLRAPHRPAFVNARTFQYPEPRTAPEGRTVTPADILPKGTPPTRQVAPPSPMQPPATTARASSGEDPKDLSSYWNRLILPAVSGFAPPAIEFESNELTLLEDLATVATHVNGGLAEASAGMGQVFARLSELHEPFSRKQVLEELFADLSTQLASQLRSNAALIQRVLPRSMTLVQSLKAEIVATSEDDGKARPVVFDRERLLRAYREAEETLVLLRHRQELLGCVAAELEDLGREYRRLSATSVPVSLIAREYPRIMAQALAPLTGAKLPTAATRSQADGSSGS